MNDKVKEYLEKAEEAITANDYDKAQLWIRMAEVATDAVWRSGGGA